MIETSPLGALLTDERLFMQLEKKREYIHAWVDEATEDQLTGLIREIARQVLAGSITATDKTDHKNKKPNRAKKSATVLPIKPV